MNPYVITSAFVLGACTVGVLVWALMVNRKRTDPRPNVFREQARRRQGLYDEEDS